MFVQILRVSILLTVALVVPDYSIEVRVRDRVTGQSLVQTAKFTIVP